MKKKKIFSGLSGILIGCIGFLLITDAIAKPTNVGVSLNPIESLETYYFGFVWVMGDLGWFVGSLLLVGFLALLYFIGVWIYKKTGSKIN